MKYCHVCLNFKKKKVSLFHTEMCPVSSWLQATSLWQIYWWEENTTQGDTIVSPEWTHWSQKSSFCHVNWRGAGHRLDSSRSWENRLSCRAFPNYPKTSAVLLFSLFFFSFLFFGVFWFPNSLRGKCSPSEWVQVTITASCSQ